MAKTKQTKASPVAKHEDGTVQITLNVPWADIEVKKKEVADEMGKEMQIKGFRKGKAPLDKIMATISPEILTEKTLSRLLPQIYTDALKSENITPAMYPKFELIHAHDGEDWQVRAVTCEFPEINLGEYKKAVKDAALKDTKNMPVEEKESIAINALLSSVEVNIPKLLIEEEANSRLSSLLERLEKLGLSLENYLASMKKDAASLRSEYESQAQSAIKLDFALAKVANEEKIEVLDTEVQEYLNVAGDTNTANVTDNNERTETIKIFLRKRKALESLTALFPNNE